MRSLTIEEELIRLDPLWRQAKPIHHYWVECVPVPKVSMSSAEYDAGILRQLVGVKNERHYFWILNDFYKVNNYECKRLFERIKWEQEKVWEKEKCQK